MHSSSLPALWRSTVERHGERPALTAQGVSLAWGDLHARVEAWAGWLVSEGLVPGDRVAVLLPNSVEYVVAYFGTLLAGGVAVCLHPESLPAESARLIGHCGARVVVAGTRTWGRWQDAGLVPEVPLRVGVGRGHHGELPPGIPDWDSLGGDGRGVNRLPRVHGRSLAQIIYTSGTTGRPKGVMLAHGALWSNTTGINACLGLTCRDSGLATLPFFYSYGNSVLLTHMAAGARLVLAGDVVFWNRNLDLLISERVTGLSAVPATFALLLTRWNFDQRVYPDLRYVTSAGGALAPDLLQRLRQALPGVAVHLMYGQTEASARLSMLPPGEVDRRPESIGRGLPGVELRVCNEAGEEVPAGEVGEVVARGPNLMEGYWADPQLTAEVLHDGWLHTGDLARRDAEGYLAIVGRRSDMIKSGSWRLAPQELEELFWGESQIAEVAVVGRADPLWGEVPVACVVARESAASRGFDLNALLQRINEQLPRYKRLHAIRLLSELPRTTSGKVRRDVLREWVERAEPPAACGSPANTTEGEVPGGSGRSTGAPSADRGGERTGERTEERTEGPVHG